MRKTLTNTLFLLALTRGLAAGEGFTDAYVTFYGEVRQVGGAGTVLLQSGQLEMAFRNEGNDSNRVSLKTALRPVGAGQVKPFSYSLNVPLAYLPAANRSGDYLSIGAQAGDFRLEAVTIDGTAATLPDGSREFFSLSFANRAEQIRLDLIIEGDSTDSDGDGLPDWWEQRHALDANVADSGADPDDDGWDNLGEFRRGSDPTLSNREPSLATSELTVPELGRGGCYLRIHDSDTGAAGIVLGVDAAAVTGFALQRNGEPWSGEIDLAAIQAGELTITHLDPAIREAALPLVWSDGGEEKSGTLRLVAVAPSGTEGNDASLWLDAASLTAGASLASWPDRSGNQRTAMQPLAENQPTVGEFGRHRAVIFTRPSSHLFFDDGAFPAGDHTVLAAWQSPGDQGDPQVLFASNRGFLRLEPTARAVSYPGAPVYQSDGMAVHGHESALGAISTSAFRRRGEVLQNVFGLSFNGEEGAAEPIAPLLPTIGGRRPAVGGERVIVDAFDGHLLELLVFPVAVQEQKLRDVHDYLQSKWSGATVWDFSAALRSVTLAAAGPERHIVRGGHGDDDLRGSLISGGPGHDTLRGGEGGQTFVFGAVDTGRDTIIGFDPAEDVIDFSAHFWGERGDARQFIGTRFETNFSTSVPTLDTVLLLTYPGGNSQEVLLRDAILGAPELAQLIVEGRIRMGSLSIPTAVSLAPAPGFAENPVLRESLDESFTVELTRAGDGVAGAMEVPLGLIEDAIGGDVVLEGADSLEGDRAVIRFERGELSREITFHAVPDLDAEGEEHLEATILPHFRYSLSAGTVKFALDDDPSVWLAVTEANALTSGQPARVRVFRDGSADAPLTVHFELAGTAIEGEHIRSLPRTLVIPAGQSSGELAITTMESWDGARPRLAVVRIVPRDGYLAASPHEATIYASADGLDPAESGFDHWLSAATDGRVTSYLDLVQSSPAARVTDYLRAYAHGRQSPDRPLGSELSFRLVDQRPELLVSVASAAADLRWQVQSGSGATAWTDVTAAFSETVSADHLRFLGPPVNAAEQTQLYRLSFALENATRLEDGLARIAAPSRYGMSGGSAWRGDAASGNLLGTAEAGAVSRLIVEVDAPTLLDFEMAVLEGDGEDRLSFSINGALIAETNGSAVTVSRELLPTEPLLLMWEFRAATGMAAIRNTTPHPQ